MKKIILFALFAIVMGTFASCTSSSGDEDNTRMTGTVAEPANVSYSLKTHRWSVSYGTAKNTNMGFVDVDEVTALEITKTGACKIEGKKVTVLYPKK